MKSLDELENRLVAIEARIKTIELALGVLKNDEYHDNVRFYANEIYRLLKTYQGSGIRMSKKRIRAILGGSTLQWKQAREHLIAQDKMVDGHGTEWEVDKICSSDKGLLIPTPAEVKERLRRRAERKTLIETETKGGDTL